jgi:SAM-dependent methyltransferase
MSLHFFLGRQFLNVGAFLRSMAVMVMKPDDLIRFTRETYRQRGSIEAWAGKDVVDRGLNEPEEILLDRLPVKNGRMLLLGLGGGREAIPFAEAGFQVTGVDYIPELIALAVRNAEAKGLEIQGLVQDISDLKLPRSRYDVIWFSRSMYSVIPTQKRRLDMLRRIHDALQPNGHVVCQFFWDPAMTPGRKRLMIRRLIACLTLGNLTYEPGDILWGDIEFVHAFGSEKDLRSEFARAGFEVIHLEIFENWHGGGAVLRKRPGGRNG